MSLSGIFDGQQHLLEPGDDFPEGGATLVIDGFDEPEVELDPFESTGEPILRETSSTKPNPRLPLAPTEQAWGTLSITLTAFAMIAGFTKKQYQHVAPGVPKLETTEWSFQTDEFISERM